MSACPPYDEWVEWSFNSFHMLGLSNINGQKTSLTDITTFALIRHHP